MSENGYSNNLLSQNKNISINLKRNSDNGVSFFYEKKLPGSFFLNIKFSGLQNCNRSNFKRVIKYDADNLLTLTPINKGEPIDFSFSYSYTQGHPNPKFDSQYVYLLPLKKDKVAKVIETTNINTAYFGSEAPPKWKAYVINRTQADTICNMRKGIVVKIVDKFTTNKSLEYEYKSDMNSILIEHQDGTFASYKALKKRIFFCKIRANSLPSNPIRILRQIK